MRLTGDDDLLRIGGAAIGGDLVGLDHPVEGELDRLGVERRAVVEGHALLQREGVGEAVGGHLPALGQARDDLAFVRHPDQRLADVERDADRGVEVGHARIEVAVKVAAEGIGQGAARLDVLAHDPRPAPTGAAGRRHCVEPRGRQGGRAARCPTEKHASIERSVHGFLLHTFRISGQL